MSLTKSPFKFLDSYTKEDEQIFFGRDREIEELYQKVFESKILLVYGITGTGKTSLINCGLANKFNDSDWLPIYIRRNQNILDSVSAELSKYSYDDKETKSDQKSVLKLLQSVYLDNFKPIYLIFDQFEELFIFGKQEERKEFVDLIHTINQSDIQCKCIFVLREEYLAHITEFERTIPEFFQNRIRIEKMSPAKALETITGPCRTVGIDIEEQVANDLLKKVSKDNNNIELTYLQVLLDKVYQIAVKESSNEIAITQEIVEKIGEVEDILGEFLEQQIKSFNNSDEVLYILKSFVSVQGTKKQVSEEEVHEYLISFGQQINKEALLSVLQNLVNKRILKDKDDQDKYELIHDALAAKIFEQFTLVEKEILDVRKYVENAYYNFEKRGILLSKEDFEYLEPYRTKLILPKNLKDFVVHCRQKLDSRKRSFVRITRISAIVLVLIVAAVARDIRGRMKRADFNSEIGTLLLLSDASPVKGINKALQKWEINRNSNTLKYIILTNFQNLLATQIDSSSSFYALQKALGPVFLDAEIEQAEINSNGDYIYGWMANQSGFVFHLPSNQTHYFKLKEQPVAIQFSSRDSLIAFVYMDNKGEVLDIQGNVLYRFTTTLNELMNNRLVHFFPEGTEHLLVAHNNSAMIYNQKGDILHELKGHQDRINALDISPDGRFIATASRDKNILLWNYNKKTEKYSVYDTLSGHYDQVWSCEFNNTSKYVLTASADSMIKIWRFDGSQVNPIFRFARNLSSGARIKFNNREEDNDIYNPEVNAYYRKMCNATFSADEREIIATGYENNLGLTSGYDYNQVLFYDRSSKFNFNWIWDYLSFSDQEPYVRFPARYEKIVVSPEGDMAMVVSKPGEIKLIAAGGIHMITVQGICPMFSSDGEKIFWTESNKIHKLPVSPQKIMEVIEQFGLNTQQDSISGNIVVI